MLGCHAVQIIASETPVSGLIKVVGSTGKAESLGDYFIWFFTNQSDQIEVSWAATDDENAELDLKTTIDIGPIDTSCIESPASGFLIFTCQKEQLIIDLSRYQSDTIELYLTFLDGKIQLANGGHYDELGVPVLMVKIKK